MAYDHITVARINKDTTAYLGRNNSVAVQNMPEEIGK